ncbi:hypothetical protein RRG08_057003 [Elysia crispata]|uniref:Uncharacterized protein n=1 Tax=Elysia crispata TaxID=231223 RepID=A0AAE0Z6F5_9GAST|nr:hypothetical protein RRG08_057003 [Elysia crispata]
MGSLGQLPTAEGSNLHRNFKASTLSFGHFKHGKSAIYAKLSLSQNQTNPVTSTQNVVVSALDTRQLPLQQEGSRCSLTDTQHAVSGRKPEVPVGLPGSCVLVFNLPELFRLHCAAVLQGFGKHFGFYVELFERVLSLVFSYQIARNDVGSSGLEPAHLPPSFNQRSRRQARLFPGSLSVLQQLPTAIHLHSGEQVAWVGEGVQSSYRTCCL